MWMWKCRYYLPASPSGSGSYFNSTVETTVFAPRGGNAAIDCAVGNLGDSTVREEYSVYT